MFTKITKTTTVAMLFAAAFVVLTINVSTAKAVVAIESETSFELCSDGIDNDGDMSIDEADFDCAAFGEPEVEEPVLDAENTLELCSDGIDNDGDMSIDEADFDCAAFGENPEQPENPTQPEDNDNNSGRRNGSSKKKSDSNQGEVLGASTDGSCKILTSYMKIGNDNNVDEVKMLQSFLNGDLGINLPVTGFFGSQTFQAVKDFQLKYKLNTLKPWVEAGLHSSEDIATGYVYKTTQYTINKMLCPEMEIAEPVLN